MISFLAFGVIRVAIAALVVTAIGRLLGDAHARLRHRLALFASAALLVPSTIALPLLPAAPSNTAGAGRTVATLALVYAAGVAIFAAALLRDVIAIALL